MVEMVKNLGIIGFGEMGKRICHDLILASGQAIKIIAAIEPSDEKFNDGVAWIKTQPIRYQTIKEMIASINLDGVIIASPNNIHYQNLQELEGQGFPIFLEKPLDSDFVKICRVLKFYDEYKGPILVDHVMRYAPILLKAKQLLSLGSIGRICSFNFIQNCYYGNRLYHTFRRTMADGGGMFIEKATHDFDILLSFLGKKPVKVTAVSKRQVFGGYKSNCLRCSDCNEQFYCKDSAKNIIYNMGNDIHSDGISEDDFCVYAQNIDVPDNEACLIEFEDGIFGTYSQCFFSSASYRGREYEIIGDAGIMRISLSSAGNEEKGKIIICPRYGMSKESFEWNYDYRNQIHYNGGYNVARHFYKIMESKIKPYTTVEQAFAAELLGYAATISANESKSINILDLLDKDDIRSFWNSNWEKTYNLEL